MIDAEQLRRYIVAPAIKHLSLWSQAAENLVLLTAAVESHLGTYVHQVGGGPALGIWQCEPATHLDIWANYLRYHKPLGDSAAQLAPSLHRIADPACPVLPDALMASTWYAAAICRLHYRRFPDPLPAAGDWDAMAALWKRRYNGPGKGTEAKALEAAKACGVMG